MINLPIIPILGAAFTVCVRLTGLMLFAPFFGSVTIPPRVKAMFVLAMTILLAPSTAHQALPQHPSEWPMLIITEFTIGVGMGLATNLVFEAAQLAGAILGVQMGYSLINILDPQTQVDTTVVSTLYQSIIMLLFLRMDVHLWLLRAISNSFSYLPPGSAHLNGKFATEVLQSAGSIFSVGIQIAAPVLAATLAADIVLGLLGKASPQMPLMLLGPAFKSMLGLGILTVTLKYWPDLFERLFTASMTRGEQLLHLAS
jgi:flagellar biosynthesis protein FliR